MGVSGHKLQRGHSTWATQAPRARFQMGKAVAGSRCKDRWARSIFNNTRPPLSLYHCRDAEWAQHGSSVQLMETEKFWLEILMFWESLNCLGPTSLQTRPLTLCTPSNTSGQKKSDHGDLLQSPEITHTALFQALKEKQEECWSGFGNTLFSLLTYTK